MNRRRFLTKLVNQLALTLLLVSNVCFYTEEYLIIYTLMSMAGMFVAFAGNVRSFSLKFRPAGCVFWLAAVYSLIFFYGFAFLQAGEFNSDALLFRLGEELATFIIMRELVRFRVKTVTKPFIIAGIFSIGMMIYEEGTAILEGGMRVGDTLSGNTNTVAYNLSLIALLVVWTFCAEHKFKYLLLFIAFMPFIFITGSKKGLIVIGFGFMMLMYYNRKNVFMWVAVLIGAAAAIYVVFEVDYFYNIVGFRIEDMYYTLTGQATRLNYSYSTEERTYMINEGFQFFLDKPIFGGGFNYFYSRTATDWEYSHCNYIEMLCTFGVTGTLVYYSKHISNLVRLFIAKADSDRIRDLRTIAIFLVFTALALDVTAVSFSQQMVWYLPIIISCCCLDEMGRIKRMHHRAALPVKAEAVIKPGRRRMPEDERRRRERLRDISRNRSAEMRSRAWERIKK